MNKTLVLGLGNELLSDDAVGIHVVRELRRRFSDRGDLVFQEASVAGLAILDLVCGYQKLVVIDAIETEEGKPGQIYRLSQDTFKEDVPFWSAHGIGISTALDLGRRCGCQVPQDVIFYAVEVTDVRTWHRGCTPAVVKAIPAVVQRILKEELCAGHASVDEPEGKGEEGF
ncbi:hydrogenase maturation protease [bacterium]|nr:hydrogenase maturation protease [bacterium]